MAADKAHVLELITIVVAAGSNTRFVGLQAVDIDSNMVVIDILDRVELNNKDMIGHVAIVVYIEEAQVLAWEGSGEVCGAKDEAGDAVTTEIRDLRENDEHRCSREGVGFTSLLLEVKRFWVEGMGLHLPHRVGQLEEAIRCNGGDAVNVQVGAAESIEDEIIVT